jgi:hypothetical protein
MPIFSPAPAPLFTQRSLTTLLKDQNHKMENTIDELSDDVFLQNSADDMIEAISQDAYLPPIELHADKGISHPPIEVSNIIVNQSGVPINGFRYSIEVPYTGASGLFNHQPETHDLEKPTAQLNSHSLQGSIIINRIATAEVTPEELAAAFDAELDKVGRYIGYQAIQIDPFNVSLKVEATRIVHGRRDRLLRARKIAASLGYPLHHRSGAPQTYISPMVRRQIKTTMSGSFQPEPTIDETEYQNILRIIENMSFVMERNPKVFSVAPEETIRDHYLVQLNGQYEGSATGETFNGEGKTDILVRDGSANLFIAECNVWHGQKQFIEAIDQLLGYVTWRDTKTAIIIFNRNQATTPVVETVMTIIEAHANYKRDAKMESPTRLRAIFGRPDDATREITITVLVVPIPKVVSCPLLAAGPDPKRDSCVCRSNLMQQAVADIVRN